MTDDWPVHYRTQTGRALCGLPTPIRTTIRIAAVTCEDCKQDLDTAEES